MVEGRARAQSPSPSPSHTGQASQTGMGRVQSSLWQHGPHPHSQQAPGMEAGSGLGAPCSFSWVGGSWGCLAVPDAQKCPTVEPPPLHQRPLACKAWRSVCKHPWMDAVHTSKLTSQGQARCHTGLPTMQPQGVPESWGITVNNRPAHSPVAGLLHHRCGAVSLPHPAHRGYGSSSAQGPSPISTQVGSAQAQQLLSQGHSCSSLPPSGKKCATDGTRCYGSSDVVVRLAPCLP